MIKSVEYILVIFLLTSCSAPTRSEAYQTVVVNSPSLQKSSTLGSTPTYSSTLKPSSTYTTGPTTTDTPTIIPSMTKTPIIEVSETPPHRLLSFLYYKDSYPNSGNIWTVEEDGKNLKQLTTFGYVYGYAWSPVGDRIALTHYDNGNVDLYIINADGSNLTKITSGVGAGGVIDWNGSKIAFLRILDYPYVKISYVDMSVTSRTIIDISPEIKNLGIGLNPLWGVGLRWSPNGKWIVLNHGLANGIASSDGNVFIEELLINPRWKNDSSLVISPVLYPDRGITYYNPNNKNSGYLAEVDNHVAIYSLDDKYILFCDDNAIMRMNLDGSQNTILVDAKATDPVWNSTGDKIAYVSYELIENTKLTGIYIINSDGTNPVQVISGWAESPRWQP
jgi:Tol biopolymer transport system component